MIVHACPPQTSPFKNVLLLPLARFSFASLKAVKKDDEDDSPSWPVEAANRSGYACFALLLRLVYYCCRLCQMQAWRKHRHVCGAAAAAASRIHRSRSLISPSQWRDLGDYCDYVKSLVPSTTVVPTAPEVVAEILRKIGGYIRQRPELVSQQMADAAWAQALSMRSEGQPDRLHMAWAWGFLEAAVESGSADAFLMALRINDAAAADLPRVNRWMKRGLCQALLMLNKRQEVGGFFRAAPMQQLLYF